MAPGRYPTTLDTWTLEDLQAQIAWVLAVTPSAATAWVIAVTKGGEERVLRSIHYAHGEVTLDLGKDVSGE